MNWDISYKSGGVGELGHFIQVWGVGELGHFIQVRGCV